ncbi:hypothetical protein K431DRAFT_203590, partial [Polychaeton citri CBS 116435]
TDKKGATYKVNCDYDYPGNDIASVGVSSFVDCFAACDALKGCIAFSFLSGTCYLKEFAANGGKPSNSADAAALVRRSDGSLPTKEPTSTSTKPHKPTGHIAPVSGSCAKMKSTRVSTFTVGCSKYQISCSTDYQNSDVGAVQVTSYQECFQACDDFDGCVAFSFFASTCYLKSAANNG